MNTFDKIRPIIADAINVSPEIITPALSISDIPEWDSVGNLAIISQLEGKLGLEFPIEDLFELNSVAALVAEIDKLSK